MSESDLHPDAEAGLAEGAENASATNELAGEKRSDADGTAAPSEPRVESAAEAVAEACSQPVPEETAGDAPGDDADQAALSDGQPEEPVPEDSAFDEPEVRQPEEPLPEDSASDEFEDGPAEEPLPEESGSDEPAEAIAEEPGDPVEDAAVDGEAEGQGEDPGDPPAHEDGPKERPARRRAAKSDPAANESIFVQEPIPTHATVEAVDPELDDVDAAAIEQPTEEDEEYTDTPFDKIVAKARRLSPERIRTVLESLLFVTDKPLNEEAMRGCTGLEVPVIREQLEKLQGSYRDGVRGIVLHEVAGGWQFRTDPTNAEYVRRFLKVKPQRLTRAALETLAIIAYRQPVTRPEIEDVRAVDCGAVIKALLERRLIKIIGKRDEPGRPLLYGTTQEFLEFFNLRDLASLPTLREFQELSEESREIVEQETGPAEAPKGTDTIVADLKDNTFQLKLAETTAEADDALAELELALADTETKAKETAEVLNPRAPQSEEKQDEDGEDDAE